MLKPMLPSTALTVLLVAAATESGPPLVKAILVILAVVVFLGGAVSVHRDRASE
jgi:hypothetical protein